MASSTVTLKPLGERLVVKRLAQEEKTAGGIILPDTAQEKPMKGEVVAIGTGKVLDNGERTRMEIEVGQKVPLGKYSGTDVKIEGEEYTILEQRDVLGVFND